MYDFYIFCFRQNQDHYKKNMTEETKQIVLKIPLMDVDLDVYNFVTKRFHQQFNQAIRR